MCYLINETDCAKMKVNQFTGEIVERMKFNGEICKGMKDDKSKTVIASFDEKIKLVMPEMEIKYKKDRQEIRLYFDNKQIHLASLLTSTTIKPHKPVQLPLIKVDTS